MAGKAFLTDNDPYPVELSIPDSPSRFLIVCDHAGDHIPTALQDRNVSPADLSRHIAIDINAYKVANVVARELNATFVSQRYSRLVADMNRPMESDEIMPKVSDGTPIPFNQNLSEAERTARLKEIYEPYHDTVGKLLDNIGGAAVLVAVHSFTPKLRNAPMRPWHVDLMSRTHGIFTTNLEHHLRSENPDLEIGQSQVFQMSDNRDFTIPFHAESRNIPNLSIEIRNDMIRTELQVLQWGQMLANFLPAALKSDSTTDAQVAI